MTASRGKAAQASMAAWFATAGSATQAASTLVPLQEHGGKNGGGDARDVVWDREALDGFEEHAELPLEDVEEGLDVGGEKKADCIAERALMELLSALATAEVQARAEAARGAGAGCPSELRVIKPKQRQALDAWQQGRDAVVLLPTGGGKSATFLLNALRSAGGGLVVEPLRALMRSMVEHVLPEGVGSAATFPSAVGRTHALRKSGSSIVAIDEAHKALPEALNPS
eukprot:jgi/Chrpa1/20773/Chrysochromulina_OHIO_Genome00022730-RA